MARPEVPITWDGPVADLACALRGLRDRAGRPGYRELAAGSHFSASVLNEAAAGRRCPTWDVTEAFAKACGADPAALSSLWAKASTASRNRRVSARRARAETRVRGAVSPAPARREPSKLAPGEPDPTTARTPAEYVRQLRALRAWAGQPGHKVISRRSGQRLRSSTMYDALSPARTSLPPLGAVEAIARACASAAAYDEWITTWRILRLDEFNRNNPEMLPEPDEQAPPAVPGQPYLRVVNDHA